MLKPIQTLNEMSISHIVIGTWAMLLNKIPCIPKDIDIWLDYSDLITIKKINSFFSLINKNMDCNIEADFCICYTNQLYKYNFISKAEGLDFKQSFNYASTININEVTLKFLCLKDIIINKTCVGREKDIIDIKKIKKYGEYFN